MKREKNRNLGFETRSSERCLEGNCEDINLLLFFPFPSRLRLLVGVEGKKGLLVGSFSGIVPSDIALDLSTNHAETEFGELEVQPPPCYLPQCSGETQTYKGK